MKMKRGHLAEYQWRNFDLNTPDIHVVPGGRHTYLWVGGENGPCYATLHGPATLRKLANEILKAVGK